MKKYVKPELKIISFGKDDIIQTSGEGGNPIIEKATPKTKVTVDGVEQEATALNSTGFDIYN